MTDIITTNPATEEQISVFKPISNEEIKKTVRNARNAFNLWKYEDEERKPFGRIKNSGFGREFSRYGMLEFVSVKSIRFYDNLTSQHYVE